MSRHSVLGGLVLFALAFSFAWSADDPKKPSDDKKDPVAKGTLPANWRKLGLTDDQVKKVYKIQTDYRTKIDTLTEQLKELKKKEMTEMETVLTDAQKARLKEIKLGEPEKKDPPPN